jgi:hypothetical protein
MKSQERICSPSVDYALELEELHKMFLSLSCIPVVVSESADLLVQEPPKNARLA